LLLIGPPALWPGTYKLGFLSNLPVYHQTPKMIHDDLNVATTQKANFGQLIFELPPTIRRIVRRVESVSKKIINAEATISFNNICP
jgi:hypothetical protein